MADLPSYIATDNDLADAGKVFSANLEVGSIGTTEIPIGLFRNPSGNTLSAKIYRLTLTNVTPLSWLRIRVYANPTVTSTGTGLVEFCTKTSAGTATVQTFSSPTVSANGFRLNQWMVTSTLGTLEIYFNFIYIFEPGVDLLLTAEADAPVRTLAVSAIWSETV